MYLYIIQQLNLSTTSYDTSKRGVSDDWLRSFCIPSNFMDCISSGIVTQRCRTEVVQTLGTLMWTHTQYPSSNSYNVVRARLVQTYPTLADDDEPGYVSSDSNENFSLLCFICDLFSLLCICECLLAVIEKQAKRQVQIFTTATYQC